MIKKLTEDTVLKFKTLTPEYKEAHGVLCRLIGKVADFTNGTRNGRKYSEELWQKLFDSELIKERFANGGIFGQLCHPDYEEVDMEKVACIMPEPPVKDKDGQLVAYVDVLDTPCGRIAYQLAKYGYKLGISSRGTGDLIDGPDGEEVDPDTYQLNAFDLVELPAVKSARLSFVESLDKKKYNKTLRQTLTEELNNASDDDKKLMEESLSDLGLNLNEARDPDKLQTKLEELGFTITGKGKTLFGADHFQVITENGDMTEEDLEELADALDAISTELEENKNGFLTYSLGLQYDGYISAGIDLRGALNESSSQETGDYFDKLKAKNPDVDLEALFDEYGEPISTIIYSEDGFNKFVKWVKETHDIEIKGLDDIEIDEKVDSNIDSEEVVNDESDVELVAEFQESLLKIKSLEKDNLELQNELSVRNTKEKSLEEDVNRYKTATIKLSSKVKDIRTLNKKVDTLTEELNKKTELLESKELRINKLVESKKQLIKANNSIKELEEKVEYLTNDLDEISEQLDNSNKLLEKYKTSYNSLKSLLVEAKAKNYGLKKTDVLQKLGESYKIKDIDSACEELSKYKQNISKLPFRLNESSKVEVKKAKEYISDDIENSDDFVSSSLLSFID